MFPIVQLGPFAVQVAPFLLLLGVLVGAHQVEKEATRLKLNAGVVSNLVFVALIAGLVGARLGYVSQHRNSYLADPLGALALNLTALASFAGIVIGVAAASIYGWRRRLPLRSTLDALAPGLVVMAVALGWAHLANGDAYGAPAKLPWSIYLWGEYRHPSQIYEITAALAILGVWWWARNKRTFDGFNFLLVVALYAMMTIFFEAFRGDSLTFAGGWRAAQVAGVAVLAACLVGMWVWSRASSGQSESSL
jgi:phosphatidylglycerol---prolipoprotein diacylglyceryl transferase